MKLMSSHGLCEGFCGLALPAWEGVGVDVGGDGDAGVPQSLADDDDVLPLLQRH